MMERAQAMHGWIHSVLLLLLLGSIAAAASPTTLPTVIDTVPGTLIRLEMIQLPAGEVELRIPGQEQLRTVPVKAIWMARTELTWDAYDVWLLQRDLPEGQRFELETRPSLPYGVADHGFGHSGFAAIGIHSHAARMFCQWLSEKTGRRYRLPTEAEWEYACRAGADGEPFEDEEELGKVAWYEDNSCNELDDPVAHRVGAKEPNAWGLHDMLGNVGEWVMADDGTPVVKGGSFRDAARRVHSRRRVPYQPSWQFSDPAGPKSRWWLRDAPHVGFRIVREEP